MARPGNFYAPTVLVNVPKDSPAHKEEMFGPVASVFRAKDINDAIRIANDSRFGLGASAWTNDPTEQQKFVTELEPGMVFINRMVASDPRIPFGGGKWSGHGRELVAVGIREFANMKTVWVEQGWKHLQDIVPSGIVVRQLDHIAICAFFGRCPPSLVLRSWNRLSLHGSGG